MTRGFIVSVLLIASACVLVVKSLEYRDLEQLGAQNCPSKNSCPRISSKFDERICECDSACAFYKDCCIDAEGGRPKRVTTQICMPFGINSNDGVYAIAECPSSYDGPAEVRGQCRNGDSRDPILNTPVTDTSKRRTYKNGYCAFCHGATSTDMTTWLISTCKVNGGTHKLSWDDIIYREEVKKWGRKQGGVFEPCDFMFDIPRSVKRSVRLCRPNLVSSCPKSYSRATYRRACEAYMSAVEAGAKHYRNPHCAICNDVPVHTIKCYKPGGIPGNRKEFSFALLLDVNRRDGDRVGVRNHCGSGQKYDPFFKKCRTLVCAIPGYTMVADKCVKQ